MAYCLIQMKTHICRRGGAVLSSVRNVQDMSWRHTVTSSICIWLMGLAQEGHIDRIRHNYKHPKNVIDQDVIQVMMKMIPFHPAIFVQENGGG